MEHYAIGDVHGEYETLIKLTDQLPNDAKLIFVGDLIDRGPESSKVVEFVRSKNYQCVLGNHEYMMVEEAILMKEMRTEYMIDELWAINGGLVTLESYGIIEFVEEGMFIYTKNEENIDRFIDDAEWMKRLPLYIVADTKWKEHYDIIVSHAAIGEKWPAVIGHENHKSMFYHKYREHLTWNRAQRGAYKTFQMFNVFGHTPQKNVYVDVLNTTLGRNWANIDSGCAYEREGFKRLTALNLTTMERVVQNR